MAARRGLPWTLLPASPPPAYVSFVSPEAQFTPKQVETRSERSKLMFRVKIPHVPEELVASYLEYIKTGVRGVGYVKLDQYAVWPDRLQNLLTPTPPRSRARRYPPVHDSRRCLDAQP